jgi:hypothetical protein
MTYSLWDEAARDINEEASLRTQASTRVASRDLMPYVALARTEAELGHRLALAEDAISTVAASAGVGPSDVEAHLRSQWALLMEASGKPWETDSDGDADDSDSDDSDDSDDDSSDDADDSGSDDQDDDSDSDDSGDDDSDDDDDDSDDDSGNPFGKSGSRLPFEGSQVTAGGDTWRSHTIDDPEGSEYTVAPKEHADALNARFEHGSGPVVWHPTKPNTLVHDPNNFWDGPRHVTVNDDGSYGYSGYHGDETFDSSGKTLTQNGKPYSPPEQRGICPECSGHGRVVSPDGKFDTGCQTCRGDGTVSLKTSSKTASGDEDTQCNAIVHSEGYGPTAINPPEYCENDVVPGTEYCANHTDHSDRYASLKSESSRFALVDIRSKDPDGGSTQPTQADYDAHKTWAISTYGKDVWDVYRQSQWDKSAPMKESSVKTANDRQECKSCGFANAYGNETCTNCQKSMASEHGLASAAGKTAINDAEMSQYSSEVANGHSNPPAGECEGCGDEAPYGHHLCDDCQQEAENSDAEHRETYGDDERSNRAHESDPYDRHADAMDRYRTYSLDQVRAMVREGAFDALAANAYDPKDDPTSWQWDRQAHPGAPKSGVPKDLFPEGGVPLRGELTPEQEAWLKKRPQHHNGAVDDSPYCGACKGGGTHPWDASKACPKCKGSGLKPKPKKAVEDATGGEALASLRKMVAEGAFDVVAQNENPNVPQPKAEAREGGPAVAGGNAPKAQGGSDLDFEPTSGTQASRREQVVAAMASRVIEENPSLSVTSALALAGETVDRFPSVVAEWNPLSFAPPQHSGDGPLTHLTEKAIEDGPKKVIDEVKKNPMHVPGTAPAKGEGEEGRSPKQKLKNGMDFAETMVDVYKMIPKK